MFRIFKKPLIARGTLLSPGITRVTDRLLQQVENQKLRYQGYGFYVPTNHILMKICKILIPLMKPEVDIRTHLYPESISQIALALGLTSPTTTGIIHRNAFYTFNCALLLTDFLDNGMLDWREIRAVRCLTHPLLECSIYSPTLNPKMHPGGTSVVGIDIISLAYQLQSWAILNAQLPSEEREGLGHFISKWILPGMVNEYMDIAFRNSLYLAAEGGTIIADPDRIERHPYDAITVAYQNETLKYMSGMLKTINRGSMQYIAALQQIPMLFAKNYLHAVPIEVMDLNSYTYWVTSIVYTDWFYRFADLLATDSRIVNDIDKILKRVDRSVNEYKVPDTLHRLSPAVASEWQRQYDYLQKKYQ